jgi:hypothetical protein
MSRNKSAANRRGKSAVNDRVKSSGPRRGYSPAYDEYDDDEDEYEYEYEEVEELEEYEEDKSPEVVNAETQRSLLNTIETFYIKESEDMLDALMASREEITHSMVQLSDEQDRYKDELLRASEGKYDFRRKKGSILF